MEYVLAYDRFYSHSDVDSDDVQPRWYVDSYDPSG